MSEHLEYKANHSHVLWALMNLGIWHRQFVEDGSRKNGAHSNVLTPAVRG